MTDWMWDVFVTIHRPDGTERQVPYGSWNEELEKRVIESGATFTLPEMPKETPKPFFGENILAPSNSELDMSEIEDMDDEELVILIRDSMPILTKKSIKNAQVICSIFDRNGYLTEKSRRVAENICKRILKDK